MLVLLLVRGRRQLFAFALCRDFQAADAGLELQKL
jgi:hypothetical protein